MAKLASDIRYVGTILSTEGRILQFPRQYFHTSRSIDLSDVKLLEIRLMLECKHILSVTQCSTTPKGEPASFYVSWALDSTPGCFNTQRRLKKYTNDVFRIITDTFALIAA